MTTSHALGALAGSSKNYEHFVEYLRDPDTPGPVLSPKRFSQAMHIDLQTLAEQAHVHRNTLSRAPSSQEGSAVSPGCLESDQISSF